MAGLALFLFSICIHLVPFIHFGANPLGYDTGFYRRYLLEPLISLPNVSVPGLGNDALMPRLVLDLLRLLHLPTDIILYGSYIFCFALLPVLIYYWLFPSLGKRGAIIAGVLMTLSSVSYNAYWYMLWKGAFALDLILLAFIFIERAKIVPSTLLSAAIALSHKTSAIIYLLSLGLLLFVTERKRDVLICLTVCAALFASVNFSLVHEATVALPSAVFLSWREFLWLSTPFLILITFGWRGLRNLPKTLVALSIVSLAYPILHLPFYERVFVYGNVALVVLAAYAAEYLIKNIRVAWVALFCIAGGLLLGNFVSQVRSLAPLMESRDIAQIEEIGGALPQNVFLLTSADETPWYEGWTTAHIIAPGLLYDMHNLEAWEAEWTATSTDIVIKFLNSFPKPLYISTLGEMSELIGPMPACLQKKSMHLYFDACGQ